MSETLLPRINSSTAIKPQRYNLSFGNETENEKTRAAKTTVRLQQDIVDFETENKNNEHKQEASDALMKSPLRLCAYTNEVGAAFIPVPGVGATIFRLSWIPALMYFGADIYNKFAKGENGDYSQPSKDSAMKAAVFQGLASVVMPTAAVILGQSVANKLSGLTSEKTLNVGQKEDVLKELKRDLNQDKLRNYRDEINQLLKDNPKLSLKEIKQLDKVKEIKKNLGDLIYKNIVVESQAFKHHQQTRGPLKTVSELIFHSHYKCQELASIKEDRFEEIVRPYLQTHLDNMVDTRIELQNAMNPNGTLNENAKLLDKSLYKKLRSELKKNMQNSDIIDKSCYAVKETVISQLQKTAIKLSTVKIAGGLVALAVLAHPIDKFVENKVIPKVGKKTDT